LEERAEMTGEGANLPPQAEPTHPLHLWIKIALQGVLLLELCFALYRGIWLTAAQVAGVMFLTTAPTRLSRRFSVYIPPEFEALAIAFIFASLFLGEIHRYYDRFWWWDLALHAGSGLLFGLIGFTLVYALNQERRIHLHMQPGFVAIFAFAFSVAAGAIWEIFEFTMDNLFGLNMQKSGLVDTMWDLIVDTIGSATIAIVGYTYMKSGEQSFAQKWIDRFVEGNPGLFSRR
jgi:hypothetical protein